MSAVSAGGKMTYILGLTGGIGMGKTTISNFLQTLDFKILDADVIARKVVEPTTPGLAELQKTFGPQIIQADQTLDRAKLGKLVFSDPKKLAQLDQIMQPLIILSGISFSPRIRSNENIRIGITFLTTSMTGNPAMIPPRILPAGIVINPISSPLEKYT